ncbi:MAG: hypothetical protein ABIV47_01825 [Roseiflexaceae bacterium]
MLNKLRNEALTLIAATPHCTLSTIGPAGVQASVVECVVREDCVYVLVPSTVDHLFNLEHEQEVVLTNSLWQLRGAALALSEADGLQGTAPYDISAQASATGYTLVEVFPIQMHLELSSQRRYRETIDFSLRVSDSSRNRVASLR